jgi:DNA-binding NarL/FixJ family response regulator
MSDVTFVYALWPVSVGLICHHDLTRCGLQQVLKASPHIRLLGYATNPAMAEAWLAHTTPQVVLIDAASVSDMAETVCMVRKVVSDPKIVAFCGWEAMAQIRHWNAVPIDAVVLTVQPPAVLVATIKGLFEQKLDHDNSPDSDRAAAAARTGITSRSRALGLTEDSWPSALTEREREVMKNLAQGLSNREIAALLRLSPVTVRHHLTNISAKLGVSGRQQLMLHGHRAGLIALKTSTESVSTDPIPF